MIFIAQKRLEQRGWCQTKIKCSYLESPKVGIDVERKFSLSCGLLISMSIDSLGFLIITSSDFI